MFGLKSSDIIPFERKISLPEIISSQEPSVMMLRKTDPESLYDFVVACATSYLEICHPSLISLAPALASDLITKNDTWKAADFINLFKFLRQNPADTNLNMNYERLIKRLPEYDLHRCEEIEIFHQKKKVQDPQLSERGQGESIKALMGKSLEEISAKNEKNRERQVYQSKSDESFFERNNRFSFTEKKVE